jgi:hypothetical protein
MSPPDWDVSKPADWYDASVPDQRQYGREKQPSSGTVSGLAGDLEGGQFIQTFHEPASPPEEICRFLFFEGPMESPETRVDQPENPIQSPAEAEEERRKLRRLQTMMSMVMSVISQDPRLTIEEASELAAGAKRAALAMFPDKEFAWELIYKPRLQRLINERFRLQ